MRGPRHYYSKLESVFFCFCLFAEVGLGSGNSPNDISKCLGQGLVSWEGEGRYLLAFLASSLCQWPEAVSYCISSLASGKECSCIVFISCGNPKTCFSLHKNMSWCSERSGKVSLLTTLFICHICKVINVFSVVKFCWRQRKLFCFICFLFNVFLLKYCVRIYTTIAPCVFVSAFYCQYSQRET